MRVECIGGPNDGERYAIDMQCGGYQELCIYRPPLSREAAGAVVANEPVRLSVYVLGQHAGRRAWIYHGERAR